MGELINNSVIKANLQSTNTLWPGHDNNAPSLDEQTQTQLEVSDQPVDIDIVRPLSAAERKTAKRGASEAYKETHSLANRAGRYGLRLAGVWLAAGAVYSAGTTIQYNLGLTGNEDYVLTSSDYVHNAKAITTGAYAAPMQFEEQVISPVASVASSTGRGIADVTSKIKELF